ncbi:hypothetical protein MY8738_007537 [Beauveria namnaoensis]
MNGPAELLVRNGVLAPASADETRVGGSHRAGPD